MNSTPSVCHAPMGSAVLCCRGGGWSYISPKYCPQRIQTYRLIMASSLVKFDSVVMNILCVWQLVIQLLWLNRAGSSIWWSVVAALKGVGTRDVQKCEVDLVGKHFQRRCFTDISKFAIIKCKSQTGLHPPWTTRHIAKWDYNADHF